MKHTKVFIILASGVSIFICTSVNILASVINNVDSSEFKTVYVAGNPSASPIESYDKKSQKYVGIMPDILNSISLKTGIKFIYINPSEKDKRMELAQQYQVELVSGCINNWKDNLQQITTSKEVLRVNDEEKDIQVYFTFTKIADQHMIEEFGVALEQIIKDELSHITVKNYINANNEKTIAIYYIIIFSCMMLVIILGVAATIFYRKKLKHAEKKELVDSFTGMGNRLWFHKSFNKIINDKNRENYAITYINLDTTNILCFNSAEELEKVILLMAQVLKSQCRPQEFCSRINNGNFIAAFMYFSKDELEQRMESICRAFYDIVCKNNFCRYNSVHMGLYCLKKRDNALEDILSFCIKACNNAIETQKCYVLCDDKMIAKINEEQNFQQQIEISFEDGYFVPFIQKAVDTKGVCVAAEVTVRWQHPELGLITPDRFISLMEKRGSIEELDFYMFREVCRMLEIRKKNGHYGIIVGCKFSPQTFASNNFSRRVIEIAKEFNFNHNELVMELTENIMISDLTCIKENIFFIHECGFKLSFDDVGSGIAAFGDIIDYPVEFIKLDKKIIDLCSSKRGYTVVSSLVKVAHTLGIKVVGKSVCTEEQEALLKSIGCNLLQGEYYYYPVPVEESGLI